MTTTINISLPKDMYQQAKRRVLEGGYTSVSELIRDSLREILYPKLTENKFTPEFETEILKRELESPESDITWDGKTPFVDFVLGK